MELPGVTPSCGSPAHPQGAQEEGDYQHANAGEQQVQQALHDNAQELHEAAEQLTASQAGLIAVGEPTIEQALDKALTGAAKVVKRTVEATTDEIISELQEALKS
jgi:F0F1-type ATP synthase membrane subunit b/b'